MRSCLSGGRSSVNRVSTCWRAIVRESTGNKLIIQGIGESFLIKGKSKSSSIIGASIYVGCFLIALVLLFLTRPILRREEYEEKFTDSELTTVRREQLT